MGKHEQKSRVLVTGAGGFIGHHLVKFLRQRGFWVRGADMKKPAFERTSANEFYILDLRSIESCTRAIEGMKQVYALAADMGGIGYITANHAALTRDNILINANTLEAARLAKVDRFLFTSSACVYPSYNQDRAAVLPLKESEAIPADPEKGYGWEKLFTEQLASYYLDDFGMDTRIVRLHNIYGPMTAYEGGREKAPASICRKVAEAEDGSAIEIWGDGLQTRSFCYINDCVEGLLRIMDSERRGPINLGTDELVTVDTLVDIVCGIAGKRLKKIHDNSRPQGVRGRNSDNTLLREVLRWEPKISLRTGLRYTYEWIWSELDRQGRSRPPAPLQLTAK